VRRFLLVSLAAFLAAGLASVVSLGFVSEAHSQATSGPYHQVVDNATAGSFEAPGWRVAPANANAFGEDYAYADPSDDVEAARFTVDIPKTDHYAVFARWPGGDDVTTAARFGVDTTSGVSWDEVDQRVDSDSWILIGIYEMKQGQRAIQLTRSPSSVGGRLVADAVMVVGGALVAPNGETATTANPDELADGETGGGGTLSTQSIEAARSGHSVLRVARKHLGTPFGFSPCRIHVREDCSCFTKLVFKKFGYHLVDSPVKQYKMNRGKRIHHKSRLRRGDLVFNDLNGGGMNNQFLDHVSIYYGNGYIIHASSYFHRVVISKLKYLRGFAGGRRLRV
jgi:cell wall-associated NlpC family hydrolase